nr:dna repair protein rad50 [Quercus suber]
MSKIDKLSILGVRSFDNTRSETIAFGTPLTLIVGSNGSGKTTIIECLKYATTGELPPNSKGGAFIHDPKLCGEKEVLAQVKVSFRSAENVKMVVTRNLQLTVKKASRSMKTLEGNLMMVRDGERRSISSRVAEIDKMMPFYLGVSKAILDSVIFCHQDESLWPMSEPSALKKRFDEIFEALKYTKAIDNIKVMAKQQKTNLLLYQKDEENTRVNKDRADKMEKQMRKLDDEISTLRERSDELSVKIKEAVANAEESWKKKEAAATIAGRLDGKRVERDAKDESVKSLLTTLVEMSDSDEQLQTMLEQYDQRVEAAREDVQSKTAVYNSLSDEMIETRLRVSAKEREVGTYEAEKFNYERQITNREKIVKETARSHNIRGFDLDIDDAKAKQFMDQITRRAKEQNAAFERARRETQDELKVAQKELNAINERKSALNSQKDSSRSTIAGHDRKISSLQVQQNAVDVDEGSIAAMQSNLQGVEARLSTAKSELSSSDWDQQADLTEVEVRRLEERKERLDAELVDASGRAKESAQLDYIQKQLRDREHSLEIMRSAHGGKITSLIGADWTPHTIAMDFDRVLREKETLEADARNQKEGTDRELDALNLKLETCRKDQQSKRFILKTAADAISNGMECQPEDYHSTLTEFYQRRDTLKADVDALQFLNEYFESCIKVAKRAKEPKCKTCARAFSTDSAQRKKEIELLIQTIQDTRQRFDAVKESADELEELEKDLENAKRLGSNFETWERLKEKEIPALERDEAELVKRKDKLNAEAEEHDSRLTDCQSAKRDVEAVQHSVKQIAEYNSDIAQNRVEIKELTEKQKIAGLATRGLSQIQDDLGKNRDEIQSVRARLVRINADRDRARSNTNTLELEVRDLRSKLSTADYNLRERKSYENQIEEYKGLRNTERETTKRIEADLQQLGPELSQSQAKYDDIARRGAEKDRELQSDASKLNNSVNQLKMADQEIDSYLERGGPEQLKRGKRETEDLRADVTRLEKEQLSITREINTLTKQLNNHGENKKSIEENQRYRRDLRALQRVRGEIAELEQHNAEEDKVFYEREGARHQMERNNLAAQQATIIGSLKSKDETLKQNIKDWETDYGEAAKKFKEATIKVVTCRACIEDLGRYGGALDKAIMKYHALKMEEINRIIAELWTKTYQGTDVDSILIRSESETAGKSNKSYNYRVCMVKQDAEMDMRGRCSAGQRVLASIIIRLALAECFGVNCGLIALDEPTTNLDSENIRALAESLSEIIKVRRAQKNFQLIVITHDEEFLRHMNCSDYADVYYRVGRNESQKSEIKRQSIADVSEDIS